MDTSVFGASGRTGRPLVARADVADVVLGLAASDRHVHDLPKITH